jgi:hypothetical protein
MESIDIKRMREALPPDISAHILQLAFNDRHVKKEQQKIDSIYLKSELRAEFYYLLNDFSYEFWDVTVNDWDDDDEARNYDLAVHVNLASKRCNQSLLISINEYYELPFDSFPKRNVHGQTVFDHRTFKADFAAWFCETWGLEAVLLELPRTLTDEDEEDNAAAAKTEWLAYLSDIILPIVKSQKRNSQQEVCK